jgi:hypothetical protein
LAGDGEAEIRGLCRMGMPLLRQMGKGSIQWWQRRELETMLLLCTFNLALLLISQQGVRDSRPFSLLFICSSSAPSVPSDQGFYWAMESLFNSGKNSSIFSRLTLPGLIASFLLGYWDSCPVKRNGTRKEFYQLLSVSWIHWKDIHITADAMYKNMLRVGFLFKQGQCPRVRMQWCKWRTLRWWEMMMV